MSLVKDKTYTGTAIKGMSFSTSFSTRKIVIDDTEFPSLDEAINYLVADGMTSRGAYDYIMSGANY